MKFTLALASFLALSSAHASYMATHCSNSSASIKWETGHNSNTLTYTTYEDQKVVPFYELNVKMDKETIIREERIHRCGYASSTRVYAGKVTITPSKDHPGALDFLGEDKKIETEVICTFHVNGRAGCPEETVETIKE